MIAFVRVQPQSKSLAGFPGAKLPDEPGGHRIDGPDAHPAEQRGSHSWRDGLEHTLKYVGVGGPGRGLPQKTPQPLRTSRSSRPP